MKVQKMETVESTATNTTSDEEFGIPIDLSDILTVCKQYNQLGWQIQNQVESLFDIGVDESVRQGIVKVESLPHIKSFLDSICDNAYFGDAAFQAEECIALIEHFEMRNPTFFTKAKN